jgi:hypothetical protein
MTRFPHFPSGSSGLARCSWVGLGSYVLASGGLPRRMPPVVPECDYGMRRLQMPH